MATGKTKSTPPTLVVFVRHGVTPTTGKILPGRAKGLHLSDEGRAQAERTAAVLAAALNPPEPSRKSKAPKPPASRSTSPTAAALTMPFALHGAFVHKVAAIYCSPMERARETAAPIATALGMKVTVERGLIECDFGEWTGAELKELAKLPEWKHIQSDPSGFRFPGGESFPEMQARVLGAVQTFRSGHPGEVVIAVSHADPIKVALADALGAHLRSMHRIWVSTASISAVSYADTDATVLTLNALGDLSALTKVG